MAEQERRTISSPVELRVVDEKSGMSGYAAVFGSATEIAGMFREQIAPGAFAEAVKRDDVRALFNHDANFVLGRSTSGTLRLIEDDKGLRYDVDVPDTAWARDLMVSVKRGDISQSSFAFEVTDEEWDYGKRGEMPMRTIKNVRLYDVSPVTYPAYSATSVSARTLQAAASGVLDATRLDVDEQWTVDNSRQRIRLSEKA
jgi:HK97 family phage prohead protease